MHELHCRNVCADYGLCSIDRLYELRGWHLLVVRCKCLPLVHRRQIFIGGSRYVLCMRRKFILCCTRNWLHELRKWIVLSKWQRNLYFVRCRYVLGIWRSNVHALCGGTLFGHRTERMHKVCCRALFDDDRCNRFN